MPLIIESLHTGPVCDQANSLTDVTTASVFPQNVPLYDYVCFMKCAATHSFQLCAPCLGLCLSPFLGLDFVHSHIISWLPDYIIYKQRCTLFKDEFYFAGYHV